MSCFFKLLCQAVFVTTFAMGFVCSFSSYGDAQELTASDGAFNDLFGRKVSVFSDSGLIGAPGDSNSGFGTGSAYYFKELGGASGAVNEVVKLTASNGTGGDFFGDAVSLFGDSALVGGDDNSAYYFANLNNANGSVNENVTLTASDLTAGDQFGDVVSLAGTSALLGAPRDDDAGSNSGSAYYFRNLNSSSGSVVENVKLTASDGAANDQFGFSVSASGDSGLAGAWLDNGRGSAYLFRNLDNATDAVTENVKLIASDGQAGDRFGFSVSLSGNSALVGATEHGSVAVQAGAVYFFRDVSSASGTVTEDAKLIASDGAVGNDLGSAVSLFGDSALVGGDADKAYYYENLATAGGTITETLILTAAEGGTRFTFGDAVSVEGDRIIVGAQSGNGATSRSGSAYTALISNMTTLDVGDVVRTHEAINFQSQTDWVIGETTDDNSLTLSNGTVITVDSVGHSIMIGAMAGSDDNSLTVQGTVRAIDLVIGAMAGNSGNQLIIEASGVLDVTNVFLAGDNQLLIEGDVTDVSDLLTYLTSTTRSTDLFADDGLGNWELVTLGNADSLLSSSFDSTTGFTTIGNISSIPEPGASVLLLGFTAMTSLSRRRK